MAESAEPTQSTGGPRPIDGSYRRVAAIPTAVYWGIHAACLLAFFTGVSVEALLLFAVTFWGRMFAITAGYHRYFSHRTYRTSRVFQFLLAVAGTTCVQKGPLWWAGLHRRHHRHADGPEDVHPAHKGFWYSHQGWIMDPKWDPTPIAWIRDFARFPELVWLNRHHYVAPVGLALLCLAIGGFQGLIWGFVISTTLLWHSTYTINSFAHRFGTRRYATKDTSRNNPWLALLTMGEGWHNNHHHYMGSTRQGFFWWEYDPTYYILRGLQAIGVVWDIREPPASVVRGERAEGVREAA